MALNNKLIALSAIFIFTAVLSAYFGLASWIGPAVIGAAAPADRAFVNGTHTNTTLQFPLTINSTNSSESCALNTSYNGAAYIVSAINWNLLNNTATTLYINTSFTEGAYRWQFWCGNATELDGNTTTVRTFYYDPNATTGSIQYPTASLMITNLTTELAPLRVLINETWWNSTNITGLWFYYTTDGTLSSNLSIAFAELGNSVNTTPVQTGQQGAIFNITSWFNLTGGSVSTGNGLANFSDIHQRPGAHTVTFCSNDTAGNRNCTQSVTFNIMSANASSVIEHYKLNYAGVNILKNIQNETGALLSSTDLMIVNAKGSSNYTLTFNRTGNITAYVVGVMFDNSSIRNITNFNLTIVPNANFTTNLTNLGFNLTVGNMSWLDVPADVLPADYKYGQFEFAGIGEFDGYFYCNGTFTSAVGPGCFKITSRCDIARNGTTWVNYTSYSTAIPSGGCYNSTGGTSANITVFTKSLSGVALVNDTRSPLVTNNTATNFRKGTIGINVTVTDRGGGTGVNTTLYYGLENMTDGALAVGGGYSILQNTTTANDYNATFNTTNVPDGLYQVRINASDQAIIPNYNTTFTIGLLRVDNTAPINSTAPFPAAGNNYDNFSLAISMTWNDTFWNQSNINLTWYYVDSGTRPDSNNTLSNVTSRLPSVAGATFNASQKFNFTSTITNPGTHTIFYCANDTVGNLRCVNNTFTIRVANSSQVKDAYTAAQGSEINLSLETGTAIQDQSMITRIGLYNYTMTVNLTNTKYLSVVGFSVNETQINSIDNGNNFTIATNGNWTTNVSDLGFNLASGDLAWITLNNSFVNATDYKFGMVNFTTQYDGYFYCNGTWGVPSCRKVNRCIATPNVTNYTAIIPNSVGGCFTTGATGATIYTILLSGGVGANDTVPPTVTINVPINGSSFNATNGVNLTVTVSDVNGGTGVNGSRVYFRFENSTTNSSWIALGNASSATVFNYTIVAGTTALDGNYTIRLNVSDGATVPDANGRNLANVNTTTMAGGIMLDSTAPTCVITQIRTDTIKTGDSLVASDFQCAPSDNMAIGPAASSASISGLDTSTTGTKTATCTVTDTANNSNRCTVAYSVSSRGSGTGSGGGGGGGGSIGETSSTIIIGDIKAGEVKTITGIDTKTNVEQIVLATTQLVSNAKISVSTLASKPTSIDITPAGKIYKYLSINAPEMSDSIIKSAEITFKVEKKWIDDNKLDKNYVRMLRFKSAVTGGSWQKLATRLSKEDNTFVYYIAQTPGFSTFAISGELLVTGAPAAETPAVAVVPPATEEVKPIAPKPTPSRQQLAAAMILILVVAGVAYLISKQKKLWR